MAAELDTLLAEAVASARAAWPNVRWPEQEFRAQLAKAVAASGAQTLETLRVEDLYLARAAAAGDVEAIVLLDAKYMARVGTAVMHLGDAAFADEVTQRLRESLLVSRPDRPPKIGDYAGRGDLLRWLRAAAVRTALSLKGGRPQVGRGNTELERLALTSADPQVEAMKRQYGERFQAALKEAVATLPPQTRLELQQYYFDGLGVEELGALYRVAPSTISRRLAKARELLAERTKETLSQRLGLRSSEVQSVLRLIHSQLDVSRGVFG